MAFPVYLATMQWLRRYETSSLAGLGAAFSHLSLSFRLCFLEVPWLALRDFAWLSVNPMIQAHGAAASPSRIPSKTK